MEKVVVEAGWDDRLEVRVLNESDIAVLMKTVVDEFEFPNYIVKTIGPFSTERVFKYDEYALAENYFNYLTLPLGN
tara:strand:+ start:85 stop:312 length:228 start_codon:yes stop_codon:yes gene_type:complete